MRQRFMVIKILAALVFLCLPGGCAKAPENKMETTFKVSVVDSLFFDAEQKTAMVGQGGNYEVFLRFIDGYTFLSCDYPDYSVEEQEDGILLTCRNVRRPVRIIVDAIETGNVDENPATSCTVIYEFNGGHGKMMEESRMEEYTLSYHLRPNTYNGRELLRNGYTLIGWNTAADGSGEHIGLGSRVTVPDGKTVTLYAEWLPWPEESLFVYRQLADGTLSLIGYRGNGDEEPFVIPEEIGGRKVTKIAGSFTTGMACGRLLSAVLVLPPTITEIESNAFSHASFHEIYFFDTLSKVARDSFPSEIETYHLNAATAPHFQKGNDNSRFADNMDRLIVRAEEKKLVFFAGCSFAYGLDSRRVEESFEGRYTVLNMGTIGGINAAFQIECMIPYLKDGDVFVHAPEEMSPFQLMASRHVDGRLFIMTEGNYDLLALADFSETYGVWDAYMNFLELREECEPGSYLEETGTYNRYGDIVIPRPYKEVNELVRDVTYSDNSYYFDNSLLTAESTARLVSYYDRIAKTGAAVCVSYAPINENASKDGSAAEDGIIFQEKQQALLAAYGYKVISDIRDYIFPGRYFYDSDYHLNRYGAILRTERLVMDLMRAGICE